MHDLTVQAKSNLAVEKPMAPPVPPSRRHLATIMPRYRSAPYVPVS